MPLASRLSDLDKKVLRDRSNPTREAWFRRYGWTLFAVLGALLVLFAGWALVVERPAMAVIPLGMGGGYLGLAAYLFGKRSRV